MSAQQQKKRLQQQNRKRNPLYEEYEGINRRAVSLFPGENFADSSCHLSMSNKITVRQQLLNIEAQRLTCCVKINAPKFKSRSALLIVRGRVLACVYGSTKIPQQLFGKKAYEKLMSEITHVGNIFDSYILPEELVLAAGSMFHGELFKATRDRTPVEALKFIVEQFEVCETPGSIALVDESDSPVCLLYFSNREVIGIYSFLDEIKMEDVTSVTQYLKSHPGTHVLASMLNFAHYNLLRDLTFSLSGLNDDEPVRQQVDRDTQTQLDAAKLILLKTVKPRDRPVTVQADRFIASGRNTAPRLNHTIQINNPFRIDPARTY